MLIKEVRNQTGLTKKAIEYYVKQGLISPVAQENGYRRFNSADVERLKRIAVLRKLNLSIGDIKQFLTESSKEVLQKLLVQKEMHLRYEEKRQEIFRNLIESDDWNNVKNELSKLEQNESILNRLLFMFPGYYGRFITMHFAPYLSEAINNDEQQKAYDTIVDFLDNVPTLEFPKDLQEYYDENTKYMTIDKITKLDENTISAINNPEEFLKENKEILETYLEYKQSDEYKRSPEAKIYVLFKQFNESIGYYDVFIPAMRKLSPKYDKYHEQILLANEKLIKSFPEIKKLDSI